MNVQEIIKEKKQIIETFNKTFNENIELKESTDDEGGIIVVMDKSHEPFILLPTEENKKFQLISFKYNSGSRWEPPSTDDYVIGEFSIGNALIKIFELIITDKLRNMVEGIWYDKMVEEEEKEIY